MSLVERLRDGIDHAKAFKAGDVLWACPALPAPEGEIRLSDVEALVERFRTLEAELSKARDALEGSRALIDRLMHVHFAPDECTSYVESSTKWFWANGGTLACIAEQQEKNRAALSQKEE